jgi:hypothetical protein
MMPSCACPSSEGFFALPSDRPTSNSSLRSFTDPPMPLDGPSCSRAEGMEWKDSHLLEP